MNYDYFGRGKSLLSSLSKLAVVVMLFLFAGSYNDASAQCNNSSQYASATAPTSGTATFSTCSFYGEYSPLYSVQANTMYTCQIAAGGYITVRQGSASGPVIAYGNSTLSWTSTVAGTYYVHWNSNSSCGSSFSCQTTSVTYVGSAIACSGTPTAGTVVTDSAACSSSSLSLSLSGATVASGLTYQWQDSLAGGAWANISGATTAAASVTQTVPSYYRCIVTCTGSSSSAYSDTVFVDQNPFYNCYCSAGATSTSYGYISQTDFSNVSYTSPSGCGQQYTNTGLTGLLLQGVPYNLSSYVSSCTGTYPYSASFKVWIDFNQNGSYSDPGEEIFAQSGTYFQTFGGTFTVPSTALTGMTGMRIMAVETSSLGSLNPCYSFTWGEVEDYTVNIQSPPTNDAGVAELVSPVVPYCGGDSVVRVTLSNYGTDTLFSANINLVINGGTPVVTNWTGMIPPLTVDTVVQIAGTNPAGSFNQGDDIVVYTTSPNGATDSLAFNDTVSLLGLNAGLSGVYTIPGSFASIEGAVDTLNEFGSCDTVWFDIASGTYDQSVIITEFPRYTVDAPVIFRSATGNAGDVVWQTTSASRLIELQGADYIWFENLTLKDTVSASQNVVHITSGADYNKVEGCYLKGSQLNTTSNTYAVIYNNSGIDVGNRIINNVIEDGSYGIYSYGSSTTSLEPGTEIVGNEIKGFYYMGTYVYYSDGLKYNGNKIHSDASYTYKYGAYFYYAMGSLEMIGNHIYPESATNGFVYPLYMSQAIGDSPLNRDMIANNVIVGGWEGSTYTLYGARFYNASFKNFHHNTFINIDGSSSSYAFLASGNNVCEYANNIYAALPTDTSATYAYGTGYGAYHTGGAVLVSDNNDYYSGGTYPLYYNGGLDLATHQANNNLDLNSYDVDPNFIDTVQAILCNDMLDNAGMAVGINEDIWGNLRNANTPDIGAVEFTGVGNFSLGPDTTICDAGTVLYIGGATSSLTWLDGNSNVIGTGSSLNVDGSTVMPVSVNFSNSCGSASDDVALDFVPNVSMDETMHLCAGESEVLMPDGSGSVNASYTWFPTNETTSQITIDGPGVYSVHKSEDGCESDATILVTQSQAVDLVDVEACQSSLPYSADATINAGDSYAWSDGGTTATNDLSTTGVYYVTATDTLGCASVDSMYFEAIDIPSAVIASDSHTSTLFFFNSMQSTGVGSNGTYAWDFGDGNTSSMANPSNNFPWSGSPVSYTVTLVITNACGTSEPVTMQVSVDPLGVNDVNGIANLSIFPNPTTGLITITGDFNGEASVEVLDVAGRVVYSANELAATDRMNLDLTGLATGAYQVKVSSGNAVSQAQVIIK